MVFENNIHWYMYKYLEIKSMQMYIYLLLLTLNVPLLMANVHLGVHVAQVGNLCLI